MQDYLKELNASQYEAATTLNGPLLILAGAGSGKTKTLVHRVAYMIDSGVPADSILLLTFTNKAADEMRNRADAMLKKLGKSCDIEATTFHSFCAKMLRIYGEGAGIDPNFRIITPAEEADAVDFVKVELGMQNIKNLPTSSKIVGYISAAANKRISLEDAIPRKFKDMAGYVEDIRDGLKKYKEDRNYLDFDDIVAAMINMLKSSEDIRQRIEDRYEYVMVDEYQDTNFAQDETLSLLRKGNKNIAVVGDDMQSIYGFRGACVQNILTFADRWPDCRIIRLETNYRSTAELLDASNKISANACDGFTKNMKSARGHGLSPVVVDTSTQDTEMEDVMDIIYNVHEEGVPYDEICILARASVSFMKLEIALQKAKIPYEKRGGEKFMDQQHIQEVLAMIRIMADPYDELAYFKFLKVLEGVGDVYARGIAERCRDYGYDGILADASEHPGRAYTSNTLQLVDKLRRLSSLDFHEALPEAIDYYIQKRTEAVDHMKTGDEVNRSQAYDKIKTDREDLDVLMEVADSYDSLNSFLDDLALNDDIHAESEGMPLVLSTVHSAKGLEFDSVIILDCTDGAMPGENVKYGSEEYDEELRCFYVAATRAKNRLFFMHPQYVMRFGKSVRGGLTKFLRGTEDITEHSMENSRKYA